MSAIDFKLVDIEKRLRVKGFRLSLHEGPNGNMLVFEKEGIKVAIERSEFPEMPNSYVEHVVESEFRKY